MISLEIKSKVTRNIYRFRLCSAIGIKLAGACKTVFHLHRAKWYTEHCKPCIKARHKATAPKSLQELQSDTKGSSSAHQIKIKLTWYTDNNSN